MLTVKGKAREKRGLKTFMDTGCASCHNSALVGGNRCQKTGLVKSYRNTGDMGRLASTGKNSDNDVFRVPSLRNVP